LALTQFIDKSAGPCFLGHPVFSTAGHIMSA